MSKKNVVEELPIHTIPNEEEGIFIKGARANNLKNVDLFIPKNKLVVVTGVSGSGKSSITMDTLFAEGQRRYVESLSSYARQFLMRMKKPDVDYIKGICPAIAIEQKTGSQNSRSTVGSLTEIYDYLRILYARIGKTYSPISGQIVKKHEVRDVVDYIQQWTNGERVLLMSALQNKYERPLEQELNLLLQKGFTRIFHENELYKIEELLENQTLDLSKDVREYHQKGYCVLIDRFVVSLDDQENRKRIADSVQTAFYEGEGDCIVQVTGKERQYFNNRLELDGMTFAEPVPHLFNYNNSFGACPRCEGFGKVMGISEEKVVPNKGLSIYEDAVACWRGEVYGEYKLAFIAHAQQFDFPIHRPYRDLTEEQKMLLWNGNDLFHGVHTFFQHLEEKTYKIQNRVMLARYRGKAACPDCASKKLRKEATYIKIGDKHIIDLLDMPVTNLASYFNTIQLSDFETEVSKRLLTEISSRLNLMNDLGLGYLTLNRPSHTLSGGEIQRINLTRVLGSNLTSSIYLLDEPSVGLHPKDTQQLIKILKNLRDLGNTVVIVEHEEEVIKQADYLVDMGPLAGVQGGEVVYAGNYEHLITTNTASLTLEYMTGARSIDIPTLRRKVTNSLKIKGASQHNLKNIDVTFPLNSLIVVTGVSGSGKTTLIKQILFPLLQKHLGSEQALDIGDHNGFEGDIKAIQKVEHISQQPIGKSSRSNPVTYVGAYDSIRNLFANHQLSKIRGYKPKHFSFNVEGGRCETCKGEGETVVEMQFLADVHLLCEECKGKRFKEEVLEVKYKDKNISEILGMSIEEALAFFNELPDVADKIRPLVEVGLGYVQLGQSSSTLSGGEAQRVKLASFLGKERVTERIFFIFDEPTTGLHFHDIQKLLIALNALVEKGHSVLVIEHNMEVIKMADWVIDLGPEGGIDGGHLIFQGRPEDLIHIEKSHTGKFLKEKMA